MGYSAYSVEVDFSIEPEQVESALAAVEAEFCGESRAAYGIAEGGFASLTDAVEQLTSFDCEFDEAGVFRLGSHVDKYFSSTDILLDVLGRFAVEGSIARFDGEDGSLFGFRVVDGQTCTEWGDYVWRLDSQLPPGPGQEVAA